MKEIRSELAPQPIGPYSQAVESMDHIFLSGQIAIDPVSGELKTGSITEETTQVMKNIKALLEEVDLRFSHIVKCSIFLKNMDDFEEVNEVYGACFHPPYPARECIQVAKLPKDVNVEISVIAETRRVGLRV